MFLEVSHASNSNGAEYTCSLSPPPPPPPPQKKKFKSVNERIVLIIKYPASTFFGNKRYCNRILKNGAQQRSRLRQLRSFTNTSHFLGGGEGGEGCIIHVWVQTITWQYPQLACMACQHQQPMNMTALPIPITMY